MSCRTPLNVCSRSDEAIGRVLSTTAHAPFALDGAEYASVEGFCASLKFADAALRAKAAGLWGLKAKHMGRKSKATTGHFQGATFRLGSPEHAALIKRAIRARFDAHPALARAFAATAPRPLVQETGHPDDSEFPAAVFCRILGELRDELLKADRTPAQ